MSEASIIEDSLSEHSSFVNSSEDQRVSDSNEYSNEDKNIDKESSGNFRSQSCNYSGNVDDTYEGLNKNLSLSHREIKADISSVSISNYSESILVNDLNPFLNHLSNPSIIVIDNSNQLEEKVCLICQVPTESINIFRIDCQDLFCHTCIAQYVEIRIQESQVLTMPCPRTDCRTLMTQQQIQNLVTEELFVKYLKFKVAEEISQDPFHKWCPAPGCEGYDIGSLNKTKLKCNKCGLVYCFYCSEPWHEKTKCKFIADKNMDKWAKSNGVKYCPNCRRKVQKTVGCDHMTCAKCRYEWCWLCGKNYYTGHNNGCEVKNLAKINPPMWKVLGLVFAPIGIFLILLIYFFYVIFKFRRGGFGNRRAQMFATRHKYFSYFCAFLLGIILTPLFLALGPIVLGVFLTYEFFRKNCCSKEHAACISVYVGPLIIPFIIGLAALGAVVAHVVGVFLLLWKFFILLVRCKNPQFLQPKYNYGYN